MMLVGAKWRDFVANNPENQEAEEAQEDAEQQQGWNINNKFFGEYRFPCR